MRLSFDRRIDHHFECWLLLLNWLDRLEICDRCFLDDNDVLILSLGFISDGHWSGLALRIDREDVAEVVLLNRLNGARK